MKIKTKLLGGILLLLLAAGGLLLFLFWDTIVVYVAPKTVLTGAVSRLYGQLEERFSGSPALLLLENYDSQGRYTAQLQAETTNALLGSIRYDLNVQTDAHRLQAQGTAATAGNELDVSVYLDDCFLAVSSEELVKGRWYGITYDSFREDIRKIPLLQYVVSDGMVSGWERSLQKIQASMERDWTGPSFSLPSREDMGIFLAGLFLLPGKVSRQQIRLDGVWTDCFRIDYTAGEELLSQEDATGAVSFYLCNKALVQADFYYAVGADRINGVIIFGTAPDSEPIAMTLKQTEGGTLSEMNLSVWTQKREGEYHEIWSMEKDGVSANVDYTWNEETGDLSLSLNGLPSVVMNLSAADDGLRIHTEDLGALLNGAGTFSQCTMTIRKGAELSVPEYKNLDQWSLEDFWTLLGGIGSLVGLQVN